MAGAMQPFLALALNPVNNLRLTDAPLAHLIDPESGSEAFKSHPAVERYQTDRNFPVSISAYAQENELAKHGLYFLPSFAVRGQDVSSNTLLVCRIGAVITAGAATGFRPGPVMTLVPLINSSGDPGKYLPSMDHERVNTKELLGLGDKDEKKKKKKSAASVWPPSSGATLFVQVLRIMDPDGPITNLEGALKTLITDDHRTKFHHPDVVFTVVVTHPRTRTRGPRKPADPNAPKRQKKEKKKEEEKKEESKSAAEVAEQLIEEAKQKTAEREEETVLASSEKPCWSPAAKQSSELEEAEKDFRSKTKAVEDE